MNNDIENLIEELTKVRLEMLDEEATKLFNTIMKVLDERDSLIIERDYYKARYLEFNEGIVAGMKIIDKRGDTNDN